MSFSSVEQALAYNAAMYEGRSDVALLILAELNPWVIKTRLSRLFTHSDSYIQVQYGYMYTCLKAKFSNQDLREKLQATAGMTLYEATQDKRYGSGWPIDQSHKCEGLKEGYENLCGKALMELRTAIDRDGPEVATKLSGTELDLITL